MLEGGPTFNCGYGSDLNAAAEVEMCAAIMEGETFAIAVAEGEVRSWGAIPN